MNDTLLPEIRSRVSRRLDYAGLSQYQIAESLGVTQTMVSKYLKKRPLRFSEPIESHVETLAMEIANSILKGEEEASRVKLLCSQCMELRATKALCPLCPVSNPRECRVCVDLLTGERFTEKDQVVSEIKRAIEIIGKLDITPLIPEVRPNIAMCTEKAESAVDVAAVPGRLIYLDGTLKYLSSPRFGVSRHLSRVLLSARKVDPTIKAVMNLKWWDDLYTVLEEEEIAVSLLNRSVHGDLPEGCERALKKGSRALVDPGGFGIEPALYIFGEGALKIALVIERILKKVKRKEVN
ncbi:MAG: hypothetical protein J7L88_05305 [Thermoplasmata archaeon]|nr:hypothetical protein [Thermoplasmata archaeon]